MSTPLEAFLSAPIERVNVGTEITYRRFGQGPAVVLVHGWPLNGATYRGLVPLLADRYTCYVPDLPGSGNTPWDPRTQEIFHDWSALLVRFVEALGLERLALVGHDSGGALARNVAAELGDRVALLTLIDTEIPGHVPGLVTLYTKLLNMPGANAIFSKLVGYRWYRRSQLGFGACFRDLAHLDGEFHLACIEPMLKDPRAAVRTFLHLDFAKVVHELAAVHRRIQAPTVLLWGERDSFFPVEKAREMSRDFSDLKGFHVLKDQGLFVQDEAPTLIANHLLPLLGRLHSSNNPQKHASLS
jgi:pimeloyl-ACP methyl ester carboxylesterase